MKVLREYIEFDLHTVYFSKDHNLGTIRYNLFKDEYSFERNTEITNLRLYPPTFYGLNPSETRELESEDIEYFIVDRVIPRNRQNLKWYLEFYGLDHWDALDILLATEGKNPMDNFYIVGEDVKKFDYNEEAKFIFSKHGEQHEIKKLDSFK